MSLRIEWATELYPSKEEENFGEAGDFAVVRLGELRRWLEASTDAWVAQEEMKARLLAELDAQEKK